MDANLKEMREDLMARLEAKIEAEMKTSNEKFEVIQSILVSQIDIHQARTEVIQDVIAQMDAHRERMGASVNAWRKEMTACLEMVKAETLAD
jgi:hypothetical protein